MLNPNLSTSTPKQPVSGDQNMIPAGRLLPFVLVTALFFLWGIPNNLNDVLIRQFMKSFEMDRFSAGLVQSAFYLGYLMLSLPAALIMRRYGYKAGLLSGLMLYAAGAFLFWPAAHAQSYGFFLVALFIIASGLAFLETGASPFIAQIGAPQTTERRLNFAQAFNPLGSISGVLIGTVFIFSGRELTPNQVQAMKATGAYASVLQQETLRVTAPYLILGCVVLLWAILIFSVRFPEVGEVHGNAGSAERGRILDLLKYPHFLQSVLAQFVYVGAQVGTWSFFIQYVQDYTHQPERIAGYFLSGTLAAFAIGRFSATYFMKFIEPGRLMGMYSLANIVLVAIGVLFPGWLGLWAIFLTSFFMSLMFPTIFALGLRGLGPNTKVGGSLIVMAIIGGAIFTPLMGLVFEKSRSMAIAMTIPLFCYIVIAYFAFIGSRMRAPGTAGA